MTRAALLLTLSVRNIFRNRRRSLFALATIAMGALGLFVFMGFNRGLMNQYRANTIRARWGHGQLYARGYRDRAHARPWEHWIATPSAAVARLRRLPGVLDLFPRLTVSAILVAGEHTAAGQGEGIDGAAEARFFTQLNYRQGGDFRDRSDGIVLGQGLALGLGAHLDDEIRLVVQGGGGPPQGAALRVTGIFHTGSQEFDSRAFRIPLAVAQTLLATDRVETIAVALAEVEAWPAFAEAVRASHPDLEAVPFDELDRIYYRHAVDWLEAQFAFIRGIIVLVVFLGIFNVISMAVLERTREIGTLRANGDGRLAVAMGHVLEAAVLAVLGAALGLAAGWALATGPLRDGVAMPPAPGITRSFRIQIELAVADAAHVLGLSVLTAVVGCLAPVWRAVRMPIAEALRHV